MKKFWCNVPTKQNASTCNKANGPKAETRALWLPLLAGTVQQEADR